MTLSRFFALMIGLLGLLAAVVLILSVRTAGEAVIRTGEAARRARAEQVVASLEAEVGTAERAVEDFEQTLALGLVDDRDPVSVRRTLTTELVALRNLTELTMTSARLEGYDDARDGEARLAADGRRQIAVFRDGRGAIADQIVDHVVVDGGADPTQHDTFRAAANRRARGHVLWSDLSYSERDGALPEAARRKTLTVQKAVFAPATGGASGGGGAARRFVGVLRAGIVSDTLDRLGMPAPGDPHVAFICDTAGRLVTRLGPGDAYTVVDANGKPDPDGDLRVVPAHVPPAIAAALDIARGGGQGAEPMTQSAKRVAQSAKRVMIDGTAYLVTLVPVAEGRTQDWLAGIVVPESAYVGALARTRSRLLLALAIVLVAIAVAGWLGARTVGRGVRSLVSSTEAMRRFSFAAAAVAPRSPFKEIGGALESVERAKTALRAMVKYVPIDLVRRLYETGRDPVLGADVAELTVMFTDIADFTTHAESLPPDRLAEALGRYLETATRAVEATGGTVDKFIGDALMVLWNAPSPLPDHPAAACRAALACAAATDALGVSTWWRDAGLPPWRTRFGLHTDRVLVGHFGAPDRLSYTAMGDGVNLAARLEGLNKVYGTTILVSDVVRARVGDAYVFRQVDRVAVKGKARAVSVYELFGPAGDAAAEARRSDVGARYETALRAAHDRGFERALEILAGLGDDGPSRVLAARCRTWLTSPPPPGWDGTWTATSK